MAIYKPDYKFQKAQKIIDNLDNSKKNELIKYYIQQKQELIEEQDRRLKEYQEVFDMMGKFLPNGKQTVYGHVYG